MDPEAKRSPIITLTTDFGSRDGYVAAMKGVILDIFPGAVLVDISHEVPPYDIPHVAFILGTACAYYPSNAVHLAVVDPGVGTTRRPMLLVTPGGMYVAPDNGLLTYILTSYGAETTHDGENPLDASAAMEPIDVSVPEGCAAYVLDRSEYWLGPVSSTFHGRDIFAPVAAHVAAGVRPERLGTAVDRVVCLDVPGPAVAEDAIRGRVVYVDRFGNLVCNIRPGDLAGRQADIEIGGRLIRGLSRTFADGDGLLALIGSHGYLEVAVTEGSAAEHLGVAVGAGVSVTLR